MMGCRQSEPRTVSLSPESGRSSGVPREEECILFSPDRLLCTSVAGEEFCFGAIFQSLKIAGESGLTACQFGISILHRYLEGESGARELENLICVLV